MIDWLFFGVIYFFTVGKLLRRKVVNPVVIGVPNAESGKMFWLAKPEKTKWDDFKDNVPPFLWGVVIGGAIIFFLML